MIKLLIWDLDDTLIDTQPLYLDKINKLGLRMASLGFDYYEAIELERKIDVEQIHGKEGVSRRRFPTSLGATYRELCKKYNIEVQEEIVSELISLGFNIYSEHSPRFNDSQELLETLKYPMCILTKGEKDIQTKRILDSGLINYFDNVFITMDKTPELFKSICTFYGVFPEEAVMIGNSIPSDIKPALEAGLYAIHIEQGTFNYEGDLQFNPTSNNRYRSTRHLLSIPNILTNIRLGVTNGTIA